MKRQLHQFLANNIFPNVQVFVYLCFAHGCQVRRSCLWEVFVAVVVQERVTADRWRDYSALKLRGDVNVSGIASTTAVLPSNYTPSPFVSSALLCVSFVERI